MKRELRYFKSWQQVDVIYFQFLRCIALVRFKKAMLVKEKFLFTGIKLKYLRVNVLLHKNSWDQLYATMCIKYVNYSELSILMLLLKQKSGIGFLVTKTESRILERWCAHYYHNF